MNIRETKHDDIIVLAIDGRLDSNTAEAFQQHLMATIDATCDKVVVDFNGLAYISSAGLRVLLIAAKRMKAEQGIFVLCGLKKHIREVFEISGFLPILTVVKTIDSALEACQA